MSIQDSKPREKQICQLFSYCELINLLRNGTIVRCLWENEKTWEKSVFREAWSSDTIVPSPLFLVSRFCTPPEVKFDTFATSKHGKGKSLWKKTFFAVLISTLGRFDRANKKNLSYTLQVRTHLRMYIIRKDSLRSNASSKQVVNFGKVWHIFCVI